MSIISSFPQCTLFVIDQSFLRKCCMYQHSLSTLNIFVFMCRIYKSEGINPPHKPHIINKTFFFIGSASPFMSVYHRLIQSFIMLAFSFLRKNDLFVEFSTNKSFSAINSRYIIILNFTKERGIPIMKKRIMKLAALLFSAALLTLPGTAFSFRQTASGVSTYSISSHSTVNAAPLSDEDVAHGSH